MAFKYDFSIIIPVYNNEKYIKECIRSVLEQDYNVSKIQLILIDDGSTDNSFLICKEYAKLYSNILLIHQKNKGVSAARNLGIKKALGKYILFLDSDDYLSENVCSTIYPFFEKHKKTIDIVTYPILYNDNSKINKHFRYSKIYVKNSAVYDLNKYSELIQTTINICIKNEGKNTPLFNTKIHFSEDEDYATSILIKKMKIGFCEECTYFYRRHNENTNAAYRVTTSAFYSMLNFYKSKLQKNHQMTYIQNLFLNTLRWRLEENKLFPYTNDLSLQKQVLKRLQALLKYIPVEQIMRLTYLKVRTRLALLQLKEIPYQAYLNAHQVIVLVNQKKYPFKNKMHVTIEKVGKNFVSGKIEKAFDLFNNFNNPNLRLDTYAIYQASYIDNLFEYYFYLKIDHQCCNLIDELNHYENITVNTKNINSLFYNVIYQYPNLTIQKKSNKRIIKNLLKKMLQFVKVWTLMRRLYIKCKGHIKRLLQKIRRSSNILLYKYYCKRVPLDKNKILFLSASRETLTGNFEFVYHELKENYHYEINAVLKKSLKTKNSLKEQIHLMKLIASSKYVLLDDFYPMIYTLKLRKGTELIQLWHAMGAFKTVGYSRMGKVGGPSVKSLTHKNYTATIVSSENIRKNYAEAFDISIDKVHALGIPRTDIFFDNNYKRNITKKLHKKYPFIKDKKVILFAPTFRGNGQKSAHYNFSWLDFNKMKEQLQDQYVFLIKLHPFITASPDIVDNQFYFDLSDEREINDLLFITDVLITDYSSVIFEYSFFKKPVVFFIPDYKEYVASRDFYYDFDKYMYGSTATNTDGLIKEIQKGKVNKKKIDAFIKYFCSACDGKSTERVVKELIVNKK